MKCFLSRVFLRNPINELKLARQAKLGKVTIQGVNRIVMLALENLIPCYDVARLAVNDVNFGDEAVCFSIFLNHTYTVPYKTRKVKNFFQLFF